MNMTQKLWLTIAAALTLLCFVGITNATDVKVTCTAPTQFEDGSLITTPITYSLYGGLQGTTKLKLSSGATTCNFTRTSVAVGNQEYYVTSVVNGFESVPSDIAGITILAPKPKAPSGTVVVTITVTP